MVRSKLLSKNWKVKVLIQQEMIYSHCHLLQSCEIQEQHNEYHDLKSLWGWEFEKVINSPIQLKINLATNPYTVQQ